jgi:flagellar motor protein MotB
MVKAGTCTLSATQAGTTNYSAATTVTHSFEINLATQASFSLTSTTATYGANLTLTTSGGSGTGSVTFTKVSGDCSVAGTTLTPTAAGSCVVTASKAADTQYASTTDTQTVTINRANQSIPLTLASTTVIYGQTLTLSGSGGQGTGSITFAVSAGTCSLNGAILTPGDASSLCEVEVTRAQSANYNALTSSPISITIQRATPTVGSLVLSTKTYGDAPFTFTAPSADYNSATVAGSWSYASAHTAVVSVNGSTATITGGGTSVITATFTPTDAVNFTTASTNATLTVDKAIPTFAWSNVSATYNDADLTIVSPAVATTAATGTWSYSSANTSVIAIAGTKFDILDAGTAVITATFTPSNTTNYVSGGTITMTATVDRAQQATLNISSTTGTYGTQLTLTTTGGTTNGSVTWGATNGTATGCAISSGKLVTTSAGTCVVTATMAGNGNYYSVSNLGTTVTMERAEQSTLTVTTSSITYRTPVVLQASGGTEGDLSFSVVSAGTAGCSIENDTLSATGNAGATCTVTATRAGTTNYLQKTSSTATITVTPRAITVTATAKEKTYGDADPGFTFVVTTGSLFGTDSFTGSLGRAVGENVGTYNITRGTLANSNYTITYVTALLTINQRPITITAANKNKIFGQSDPTLTYSVTSGNVVNSDNFTGSITRAVGETLGNYNITRGTLDNGNYNITFVNGTLTITGAPQAGFTLTSSSYSVTYQQTVTLQTSGGNGSGTVTYTIQNGTGECSVAGTTLTGVNAGTCAVTAVKAAEGGYLEATSNTITITVDKANQTISIATIADHDFSATPMTVTATATSGHQVVMTSRTPNVCTMENSGIVMKFSGTCTVEADVASSRNYNAAPTVTRSFEIRAVVPFAPTITSVEPGDTNISIAFTAGLHGGASITTYHYSLNDGAQWTELPNGTITSPLVIGNLPNNVEARVRIMAVNRVGAGAASNMRTATPVARRSPVWETQRSTVDSTATSLANQLPPRPAVVRSRSVQGGRRTQVTATRAAKDVNIPVTHAIISVRLKNGKLLARIQVRVDSNNPTTTVTVPYKSSLVNISVQFANDIGLSPGGVAGTNIAEGNTFEWTTVEGSASLVGNEVPGGIYFERGSSQLTYTAQQTLKKMATTIQKRGGLVYVTGFAQNGERRSAWTLDSLARARAEAVSKYLSRLGIRQWITFHGTTTKAANGWKPISDRRVVVTTVYPNDSSSSVSS